jgi:hypothetical protein
VLSPGLLLSVAPLAAVMVIIYTQWTTLRGIYNTVNNKIPMSFLEERAANS